MKLRTERDAAIQRAETYRNRQKAGNDWAVATFGDATIESTMHRIDQELAEFYEDPVNEAKDIAIFLYRLMSVAGRDLDAEVDAKMEGNRNRTWVLNGEGCGQHSGSQAKEGIMEGRRRLEGAVAEQADEIRRLKEALQSASGAFSRIYAQTATSGCDYVFPRVAKWAQEEAAAIVGVLAVKP